MNEQAASTSRPFAGREQAIHRIHAHLIDPANTPVPAFTGRLGIGKTALLHHFAGMPNDSLVGVYVAMRRFVPQTRDAFLRALLEALFETLSALDLTISSVERPGAGDTDTLKAWMLHDLLPAVQRVIHKSRRLVWLIDDAGLLIPAGLAAGCFEDLRDFQQANVGVVVAFDIAYDDQLDAFSPLIDRAHVHRLRNLDAAACQSALKQAHIYVEGESLDALYKATGGDPILLTAFRGHLPQGEVLQEKHIRAVIPAVYVDVKAGFQVVWNSLTLYERLVLTAISGLLYDAPFRTVSTQDIETWLVQNDYSLDSATVAATIRSLEYRELVTGNTTLHIHILPGLLQTWMLENARIVPESTSMPASRRNALWISAALLGMVIVLALIIALAMTPRPVDPTQAVPTIALTTD